MDHPSRPTPPWQPPAPGARCNFHPLEEAAASYAGTPLCASCAERLAGDPPLGPLRARRAS